MASNLLETASMLLSMASNHQFGMHLGDPWSNDVDPLVLWGQGSFFRLIDSLFP